MAAVLGMTQVFNPKLPSLQPTTKKSSRVITLNPYIKKSKRKYSCLRDITELIKMKNSKYMPHQGKQECARRVKQRLKLEAKQSKQIADDNCFACA